MIYRYSGRPRWLHLGDARSIGLADARRLTARIMLDVAEGKDPLAERRAQRDAGTFADLASQYVELRAKKHNKCWKQAETTGGAPPPAQVGKAESHRHHPRRRQADDGCIEAPIVANQTLAAASAIFTWAIRQEIISVNPCHGVDRNPTSDRERILRTPRSSCSGLGSTPR